MFYELISSMAVLVRSKLIRCALVITILSIIIATGQSLELLGMLRPLPSVLGVLSLGGMALLWRDISSKVKGRTGL